MILDVGMPGLDGYETLERIRDLSDVPVLMLTARAEELERVRGLTRRRRRLRREALRASGAASPACRRCSAARRTSTVIETYADEFVEIDYRAAARDASRGDEVQLTPLEFRLLSAFVRHPNQVLSRDQLLELVWGDPTASRTTR